ncbi:hypothetical protein LCGC14_1802040 [marine sediment metagenome]|uniref:Uncharacterized protein n=1 Tax=marine sediment metagenome TaxID=412755 RepID=A0A0F9HC38_9ZZZZ
MRVIQGTADKLYRLQRSDLDFDLRQSYWRYVDFSGFSLEAYDMRDMDILDSYGAGCILPNTDWMISRRTDWTNATITDLSSYNRDLVIEAVRQNLPSLSSQALLMAKVIIARKTSDYGVSWQDTLHSIIEAGLTKAELKTEGQKVFAGWPSLLARLRYHLKNDLIRPAKPEAERTISTPVRVKLKENTWERFDFFLTGTDRYLAARAIEKSYLQRGIEVVAHVGQLDPWPWVQVSIKSRVVDEFWWKSGWPA